MNHNIYYKANHECFSKTTSQHRFRRCTIWKTCHHQSQTSPFDLLYIRTHRCYLCHQVYALLFSNAIELVHGYKAKSYMAGGGIILALFFVYVLGFGVAWYCGSGKREVLKRQAVEKQLEREKALQVLQNLEWFDLAWNNYFLSSHWFWH